MYQLDVFVYEYVQIQEISLEHEVLATTDVYRMASSVQVSTRVLLSEKDDKSSANEGLIFSPCQRRVSTPSDGGSLTSKVVSFYDLFLF